MKNFPGVWMFLENLHQAKQLFSIDRVMQEIGAGDIPEERDDLKKWIGKLKNQDFFLSSEEASNLHINEIMQKIKDRYEQGAINEFIKKADFSLIALAMNDKENYIIVSQEVSAHKSREEIRIPDVCSKCGVEHTNIFELIRIENPEFVLSN